MTTKKRTILVVDDTPENIDVLVNTLQGQHRVKAVLSGEMALEIARGTDPPDIILLDIMMPGLDGYQVARALKKDPKTDHIPIIFVTALDELENEKKGFEAGAVDYILKPISPEIVRARVNTHLELKRHRDHLEEMVYLRTQELELTREVTISSLAALAETRDNETGGHIRRTQYYVRVLARTLQLKQAFASQLDDQSIDLLYKSAPLHDIGKVGVPDAILLKPGKLTDQEFETMKKHTEFGRDTIMRAEADMGHGHVSGFLQYARQIAYSHHEKWDGTGYPLGLKGQEIPLPGRIMAVADVYDALISRRVYKPPFSHAKALGIILDGCGSHFDPDLIQAFKEKAEQFRQIALEFADHEEERELLQKED